MAWGKGLEFVGGFDVSLICFFGSLVERFEFSRGGGLGRCVSIGVGVGRLTQKISGVTPT